MKSKKNLLLIGGSILIVLILTILIVSGWWIWRNRTGFTEQPSLRIFQPQPNTNLNLYNSVAVQAAANVKNSSITWLRFYVDDLLRGEQTGPAQDIIGTWTWTPTEAGMHTLAFVASTEQGTENMITLPVTVLAAVDSDGDHLPDAQDACPDQPGTENNQGCPIPEDSDRDGVRDAEDACPQEVGVAEQHGCLTMNRPDQDHDGTPDWEDRCPYEAGIPQWNGCPQDALVIDRDCDGLINASDWCPTQPGAANNHGCPVIQAGDQDGDGVPDTQDHCLDQPGTSYDGCPLINDHDQDGIPDDVDPCPDNPNPNFACSDTIDRTDTDGDGVWDIQDECDNEPGPLDNLGCPLQNDQDNDGVPDEQDNCATRAGSPENSGCPNERNFPRVHIQGNILCQLFPAQCTPEDPCITHPESCDSDQDGINNAEDTCPDTIGIPPLGCPVFPGDRDGDGVPDQPDWDRCPDQFGYSTNRGCPIDSDGDGNPDPDPDRDGMPNLNGQDSCPDLPGSQSNNGCPRQNVDLTLNIMGFIVHDFQYSNFYCYAILQGFPWGRIPPEGSLDRSGQVYYVEQSIYFDNFPGNGSLRFYVFCEGQQNPLDPVQRVGEIVRSHGPESWNSQIMDAFSENGQLAVEYQICEGSCP